MSVRSWWRRWLPRHRWLISYPPQVDDGHTFAGENDPASDPLRLEWAAERGYDKRGRLGDSEYRSDEIDT